MENTLSYIGSFASIGSIPLAIYLYLKSKEQKVDKVRLQILKIISYQIGENRLLSEFEIGKVINSNIRNNKLPHGSISLRNILEDLVSDTISSPLLNAERKDEILKNLKTIFPDVAATKVVTKQDSDSSTLFALSTVIFSLIPLSMSLIVGEDGWNSSIEKWLNFNTVEGYFPNLIMGAVLAFLGLIISFLIHKAREVKIERVVTHNKPLKQDK